jgi:hypothetical protein
VGKKVTVYNKRGERAQVRYGNGSWVNFNKSTGARTYYRGGVARYTERRTASGSSRRITREYRYGSRSYIRNYNISVHRGYSYQVYVPGAFYEPAYYGYLYRPWHTPFHYSWGWRSAPWVTYYGYYYQPYPTYYAPAYWLTDFFLASLLEQQYLASVETSALRAQAAAVGAEEQALNAEAMAEYAQRGTAAPSPNHVANTEATPITEEVKEQIKAQVEEAIRAHEEKQTLTVEQLAQDTRHVFAVGDDLEVAIRDSEQSCSLTQGDLIRLAEIPAPDSPAATLQVVTSKKGSCPPNAVVTVSMSDLQDMVNDFTGTLEQGMEKMKKEIANQ